MDLEKRVADLEHVVEQQNSALIGLALECCSSKLALGVLVRALRLHGGITDDRLQEMLEMATGELTGNPKIPGDAYAQSIMDSLAPIFRTGGLSGDALPVAPGARKRH